jgi:carbon monoxide dehydrogenase subunit G
MDMSGEALIAAPRERVYAALNDIEILRQSIPGCETIEWESDNEMTATVVAKVGPVKAKFAGRVTLSNRIPPEGYTISGEGKGGAAGFAKGGATVRLAAQDSGTLMTYQVHADVGGKLAQLGGRLIDGTARKMADEFFANFSAAVEVGEAVQDTATKVSETSKAPERQTMARDERRIGWLVWAGAAAIAAIISILLFSG